MTTLVSTNVSSVAELNSWWTGIGGDAISGDKQYVARLAAGAYTDSTNTQYMGKTSDYGATDVGFGTARLVITSQEGAGLDSANPLRFDSTKGVALSNTAGLTVQSGMSIRNIQLQLSAYSNTFNGVIDRCYVNMLNGYAIAANSGGKAINSHFHGVSAGPFVINDVCSMYGCGFTSQTNNLVVRGNGSYLNAVVIDCYAANLYSSPTVDP